MFQFPGFALLNLCIQSKSTYLSPLLSTLKGNNNKLLGGLPHSEIHGSKLILSSPWLIAEYHVFHRLLLPRHSPNALFALDLIQKKQGRLRPLSPSAITSERILCADWAATGTKVILFPMPATGSWAGTWLVYLTWTTRSFQVGYMKKTEETVLDHAFQSLKFSSPES